eukprot:TRINITY_DN102_c0_g1_i1.p1 TRINITY_DN102_c0_g1~~TRINITY_DN102_c0_g1_i1.p1  ORF type:complete len:304 (+),score=76.68 TRINITY_DN102_c0_g1_i1:110-1021(+)
MLFYFFFFSMNHTKWSLIENYYEDEDEISLIKRDCICIMRELFFMSQKCNFIQRSQLKKYISKQMGETEKISKKKRSEYFDIIIHLLLDPLTSPLIDLGYKLEDMGFEMESYNTSIDFENLIHPGPFFLKLNNKTVYNKYKSGISSTDHHFVSLWGAQFNDRMAFVGEYLLFCLFIAYPDNVKQSNLIQQLINQRFFGDEEISNLTTEQELELDKILKMLQNKQLIQKDEIRNTLSLGLFFWIAVDPVIFIGELIKIMGDGDKRVLERKFQIILNYETEKGLNSFSNWKPLEILSKLYDDYLS